jgi:hypothetical protein
MGGIWRLLSIHGPQLLEWCYSLGFLEGQLLGPWLSAERVWRQSGLEFCIVVSVVCVLGFYFVGRHHSL